MSSHLTLPRVNVETIGLISGLSTRADIETSYEKRNLRHAHSAPAAAGSKQSLSSSSSPPAYIPPIPIAQHQNGTQQQQQQRDTLHHNNSAKDDALRTGSGRIRDRYGFLVPEEVADMYCAWLIQSRVAIADKHHRFAHILNNHREPYTDREMGELVRSGVPPQSRRRVWTQLSGIEWEMLHRPAYYQSLLEQTHTSSQSARDQVGLDVARTFQDNKRFGTKEQEQKLGNVLNAYHVHDPVNGYSQGLNFIVSSFLILEFEEEEAFWMLCHIMRMFPFNFDRELTGSTADCAVFSYYFRACLPKLYNFFVKHEVDTMLFFVPWSMQLFVSVLQYENTFRIWDRIMYNGAIEFFRCSLKLLNYIQHDIYALEGFSPTDILVKLTEVLHNIVDIDKALSVMPGKQTMETGGLQFRRMRKRAELRKERQDDRRRRQIALQLGKGARSETIPLSQTVSPHHSPSLRPLRNSGLRRAASIRNAKNGATKPLSNSSSCTTTESQDEASDSETILDIPLPLNMTRPSEVPGDLAAKLPPPIAASRSVTTTSDDEEEKEQKK